MACIYMTRTGKNIWTQQQESECVLWAMVMRAGKQPSLISLIKLHILRIFFTICQNQFIKAHNISQWISQTNQEWTTSQIIKAVFFNAFPSRELKEDFKQFENTGNAKESLRQRYLPTIILSLPYLYSLLFAPTIPIFVLSTIIGIALHKYFNLALKSKLNIFDDETIEETITVSDFLANKQTIDLSNIQGPMFLQVLLLKNSFQAIQESFLLCYKQF